MLEPCKNMPNILRIVRVCIQFSALSVAFFETLPPYVCRLKVTISIRSIIFNYYIYVTSQINKVENDLTKASRENIGQQAKHSDEINKITKEHEKQVRLCIQHLPLAKYTYFTSQALTKLGLGVLAPLETYWGVHPP